MSKQQKYEQRTLICTSDWLFDVTIFSNAASFETHPPWYTSDVSLAMSMSTTLSLAKRAGSTLDAPPPLPIAPAPRPAPFFSTWRRPALVALEREEAETRFEATFEASPPDSATSASHDASTAPQYR
jgi:hypothetical protein